MMSLLIASIDHFDLVWKFLMNIIFIIKVFHENL